MKYTKTDINKWTISFILFLLFVSSLGYLFMPAQMLSIVGIEGTKESNFLVKTVAAALLSLIPSAFAITRTNSSINVKWYVVLGLAMYMFISSLVDLAGYLTEVVNFNSVPSIVFRIILGLVLLATNEKKDV